MVPAEVACLVSMAITLNVVLHQVIKLAALRAAVLPVALLQVALDHFHDLELVRSMRVLVLILHSIRET